MMKQILPLDASRYQRHRIHGEDRNWAETNCYVDVWVELLHAWGFEPIAALPFTFAIDFEGDQWTFFKFRLGDLLDLFGLDVQELAIGGPLVNHIEEQVVRGRPVLVELDSFFLPDTAGTAYQREHVKSTVAVNAIDLAHEQMGYFHNQSYHMLGGDDFANVLHSRGPADPARLPPYVEFVKRRDGEALRGNELVQASLSILRRQLRLIPTANPFVAFKARFAMDVQWLVNETMETFHRYSFATLRQFGACFELSATYLQWLRENGVGELDPSIARFAELSTSAKTIQFQLARSMARKKPLDLTLLDTMAQTWQDAITDLKTRFA
jgi:Domain of unknown function (DUF1839)